MRKTILSLLFILVFFLSGCNLIGSSPEIVYYASQDTVEINTSWVDPGVLLEEGSNKSISNLNTSDVVNTTILGLYKIEYSGSLDGKDYSSIRYVIVVDTIAPVLILNLGVDTIKLNSVLTDAGVTVTDNSLEELSYTTIGTVDTSVVGAYTLIYTATDSSGNIGTVRRIVTVVE